MNSYRIGFGFFGKLAVVTALGASVAGGIALADAKPSSALAAAQVAVVQLDPVSVTISKARYAEVREELRAEAAAAATTVASR